MSRIDHIWSSNIRKFNLAEIDEASPIHSDHRPVIDFTRKRCPRMEVIQRTV